jgi:hypothetical protein
MLITKKFTCNAWSNNKRSDWDVMGTVGEVDALNPECLAAQQTDAGLRTC